MGIDVYLSWDGMTEEEEKARYTGFDVWKGNLGYLREAYHGNPYATHVLISESWESQPEDGFVISNAELMERMSEVLKAVMERCVDVYKEDDMFSIYKSMKSFADFVMLHGEKEKEGKHPKITISY